MKPSRQPDSNVAVHTAPGFIQPGMGVEYGFFGRPGGHSTGLYAGLNCGTGSGDDPATVQKNRELVRESLNADHLVSVHQVHGNICLTITGPHAGERPQADAMVTDAPGLALGILTADCGPVLFHGQKKDGSPVIGAAHAGWGGALKGILDSTVKTMTEVGAQEIRACIGPCIGKASYEVKEDFAENFLKEHEENERFFSSARREGHLMFDLPGYCAARLARLGLKQVFITDLDTYSNEAGFYSYRRKTHRGESDYGRQISAISINKS